MVDQLDLAPFYRAHRDDGHGHPAYDPKTLLGVLLYAYCLGVRSSRQVERRLHEDVAFRVLAAYQTPDHVTIARFRVRHEQALAGFLVESLRLCAAAGMVRVGTVALDGTKLVANAAERANRTHDKLRDEVAEILRQAAEADQREDGEHGDARGDELPAALASKAGRLQRLRVAKAQLEAEAAARQQRYQQRVAELAAAARAKGKQPKARIKPRRRDEAPKPEAVANVTDPDSRLVHTRKGSLQGYNAQAVTTCEQVIVATELTQQANDLQQLEPMLDATSATLAAAGVQDRPGTVLADSGYWTIANLTQLPDAPELLIPPARHGRQGKPRKDGKPSESRSDGLRAAMTARLQSDDARRATPCGSRRRAGLRPDQGCPRPAAIPAPWAACLNRGVEAAVRHPQPAQAVAAPDRPATGNASHHLSRKQERRGHQRGPPARHSAAGFPRLARPPATYPGRL